MSEFLQDAGVFLYPLALFSLAGIFIIIERLIALRESAVMSRPLREGILAGGMPQPAENDHSVAAELIRFHRKHRPDRQTFTAFAGLQINRLERGMFLLEVVISGAPLVGLLGTVSGLVEVFSRFAEGGAMPQPGEFVEGISLALTTTILGLAIAIPCLVASGFLYRRVDNHAARLNVAVQRLMEGVAKDHAAD